MKAAMAFKFCVLIFIVSFVLSSSANPLDYSERISDTIDQLGNAKHKVINFIKNMDPVASSHRLDKYKYKILNKLKETLTENERLLEQLVRAVDKYILNIMVKLGNTDSSIIYWTIPLTVLYCFRVSSPGMLQESADYELIPSDEIPSTYNNILPVNDKTPEADDDETKAVADDEDTKTSADDDDDESDESDESDVTDVANDTDESDHNSDDTPRFGNSLSQGLKQGLKQLYNHGLKHFSRGNNQDQGYDDDDNTVDDVQDDPESYGPHNNFMHNPQSDHNSMHNPHNGHSSMHNPHNEHSANHNSHHGYSANHQSNNDNSGTHKPHSDESETHRPLHENHEIFDSPSEVQEPSHIHGAPAGAHGAHGVHGAHGTHGAYHESHHGRSASHEPHKDHSVSHVPHNNGHSEHHVPHNNGHSEPHVPHNGHIPSHGHAHHHFSHSHRRH